MTSPSVPASPPASSTRPSPSGSDQLDVRIRMSGLWVAMLFIFAYVDLFSLYRPDIRADLADQQLSAFAIDQTFLLAVTVFIVVPSLLVYLTLVMPRRINRPVNLVAAGLYAVVTLGSAVGEWNYYILGSVVEACLLAVLVRHAWGWSADQH